MVVQYVLSYKEKTLTLGKIEPVGGQSGHIPGMVGQISVWMCQTVLAIQMH